MALAILLMAVAVAAAEASDSRNQNCTCKGILFGSSFFHARSLCSGRHGRDQAPILLNRSTHLFPYLSPSAFVNPNFVHGTSPVTLFGLSPEHAMIATLQPASKGPARWLGVFRLSTWTRLSVSIIVLRPSKYHFSKHFKHTTLCPLTYRGPQRRASHMCLISVFIDESCNDPRCDYSPYSF